MLLDSAAEHTVKHIGQTGGLGSIHFREWWLKMEYDGFHVGVLIFEFVWATGGRALHFVLLHPSRISLSKNFVGEESQEREEVAEMCCW